MTFRADVAASEIRATWIEELTPQLQDYVRIPALSPAFDANWESNGHIEAAVQHVLAGFRAEMSRE